MRFVDVAAGIGAQVPPGQSTGEVAIERVVAGDRMSDLLAAADARTLIVTNLTGPQLVGMAGIMDVPGICLLNARPAGPEMTAAAQRQGTLLMISPCAMYRTCGRLFALLGETAGT